MSSAKLVPETRGLTGDDAWSVLKRIGWGRLAKDAFKRMRVADGFSHARSLAFLISLVAIEGLIGIVGLASVLHKGGVSRMIDATVRRTVPGPAGHVLTTAVTQAHRVAAGHHYGALLFGVIGDGTTRTRTQSHLRGGAGPPHPEEVRTGAVFRTERRHDRCGSIRVLGLRPGPVFLHPQSRAHVRMVVCALASRRGLGGHFGYLALSLVAATPPA
jgi:hypothetical protein